MDVYERLGVKKVINAMTTATYLGASLMDRRVLGAMVEAGKSFVDLNELHEKAGRTIAEITCAEAGLVTSGAAAGLVLATAACIAGTDADKAKRLPDTRGMKNEVIVLRGHKNIRGQDPYNQCFRIAGGKLVMVGSEDRASSEDIERAISERTAALAYYPRYNKEGLVRLEDLIRIGNSQGIPVIVDAAAELPPRSNLKRFIAMGADLVAFSGGKAIGGPSDTGILCGRRDLIEAATLMCCPHHGIGRPMKVGKECLVGLITALQIYVEEDDDVEFNAWDEKVKYMVKQSGTIPYVEAKRVIGNGSTLRVPYVELTLDEKASGATADHVIRALKGGDPCIYVTTTRQTFGEPEGTILINPRSLADGEERVIVKRLKEILQSR